MRGFDNRFKDFPDYILGITKEIWEDRGLGARMKDYYDLWAIPNEMEIDPLELDAAIRATFGRRRTLIPKSLPIGLSDEFVTDAQKSQQWVAYAASIDLEGLTLEAVAGVIRSYVVASCRRLNNL